MGAREPEKDWQGAVPWCPSTGKSPLREGRVEGAPFFSKDCQGGFPHEYDLGEDHPSGRTPGPFFLWRQAHHPSQTRMLPKALSARTRDTAGTAGRMVPQDAVLQGIFPQSAEEQRHSGCQPSGNRPTGRGEDRLSEPRALDGPRHRPSR